MQQVSSTWSCGLCCGACRKIRMCGKSLHTPVSAEKFYFVIAYSFSCDHFIGTRKFAQAYMLARELGSGAFSIVKLGVNLVSLFLTIDLVCETVLAVRDSMSPAMSSPHFRVFPSLPLAQGTGSDTSISLLIAGNGPEDGGEGGFEKEIVGRGLCFSAHGNRNFVSIRPSTYNKVRSLCL